VGCVVLEEVKNGIGEGIRIRRGVFEDYFAIVVLTLSLCVFEFDD
jgi:hypothetical protein